MIQTIVFKEKVPKHYVFQINAVYGYELFQNIKPALQNHIVKNI